MCPEFDQYDSNATMFEKRDICEVERIYRVQSSEVATNLQSRSLAFDDWDSSEEWTPPLPCTALPKMVPQNPTSS
jgi:hypothetical protein